MDMSAVQDAVDSLNDTGIKPVEYKCLVRIDPVEKKTETGVHLPEEYIERQQMSTVMGTLVAVGGNAFEDWGDPKPQPGDRVVIDKYAGIVGVADASDRVRLVQDKNILAILGD